MAGQLFLLRIQLQLRKATTPIGILVIRCSGSRSKLQEKPAGARDTPAGQVTEIRAWQKLAFAKLQRNRFLAPPNIGAPPSPSATQSTLEALWILSVRFSFAAVLRARLV
jgi:hypothetical protein